MIICSGLSVGTDQNTSFVDRDMYMRFRGGGVGHVITRIEDPEAELGAGVVEPEVEGESETVIPTPELEDRAEGEREDQESGSESEDESNEQLDEDDDIGEDDELEEQDDDEGLDVDGLGQSLREVILDDLGYSEL